MKNKLISIFLLISLFSSFVFSQNISYVNPSDLCGSYYEDTLHERTRFRDYFYRITENTICVIDKKNNRKEIYFDYTLNNNKITICAKSEETSKIQSGTYSFQITDENIITIGFPKELRLILNEKSIAQAKKYQQTAGEIAVVGVGALVIGVVGEAAVASSLLGEGGTAVGATAAAVLLPKNNGKWSGAEGNSKWIPDDNYVPGDRNGTNVHQKSWKQIKKEYNFDGIEFKNNEPDFSPVSKATVKIKNFTTDRDMNFAQADAALAKKWGWSADDVLRYRKGDVKYTWHELSDCKTMILVPTEVHGNISHSGGISKMKQEGI